MLFFQENQWILKRGFNVQKNSKVLLAIHNFIRHQHRRWLARIGRVVGNKDLYLGTLKINAQKFDDVL
ncbi:hypothetical protein DVH24_028516 [Malus domestica]|uniref:Uncharacterized protein n=1 Tax=Malus domestica TaxID=3750 RepID=A0A498IUS0_MALDO|nr:hypothetical protein DVH24_028516 [Malus domestica]